MQVGTLPPLVNAALGQLQRLKGSFSDHNHVDLFMHSIQTAQRAAVQERGEDRVDIIVAALLHDIGHAVSQQDHGSIAADFLEPYLDPDWCWVVRNHQIYQDYHFQAFNSLNSGSGRMIRTRGDPILQFRQARRMIETHEPRLHEKALRFASFDMEAFDPTVECLPLSYFHAPLTKVLSRPSWWHSQCTYTPRLVPTFL